jgi:hypothetical protein
MELVCLVMSKSRKLMELCSFSSVGVNTRSSCRLFMYLRIWSGVVLSVLYTIKISSKYLVSNVMFSSSMWLRCFYSNDCRNISAMVPETGEPIVTPLCGWYIWLSKEKKIVLYI